MTSKFCLRCLFRQAKKTYLGDKNDFPKFRGTLKSWIYPKLITIDNFRTVFPSSLKNHTDEQLIVIGVALKAITDTTKRKAGSAAQNNNMDDET